MLKSVFIFLQCTKKEQILYSKLRHNVITLFAVDVKSVNVNRALGHFARTFNEPHLHALYSVFSLQFSSKIKVVAFFS